VGNLTEEKSPVIIFEFPTDEWIPEVCWKYSLVTFLIPVEAWMSVYAFILCMCSPLCR
jgi:hypothetical protein